MSETEQLCPPHHWMVESHEVERQIVDHHRCVRCGQVKATVRTSQSGWPAKAGGPAAPGRGAGPRASANAGALNQSNDGTSMAPGSRTCGFHLDVDLGVIRLE